MSARVKPAALVLNSAHPLARGLVGAWAPVLGGTGEIKDLTGRGRDLTIGGTGTAVTSVGNALGRGIKASATTYWNSTEATLRDVPVAKNFTAAWVGSGTANAVTPAAMGWYGTDDILLYPGRSDTGGPTFFWRDVSGTDVYATSVMDGNPHAIAWSSYATSDHRMYVDGIRRVSDTSSRAGAGPFTGFFILAWPDTTSQDLDAIPNNCSNLFAVWSRALTQKEHAEFAADPFAMFYPTRKRVVARVSAGGSGAQSINAGRASETDSARALTASTTLSTAINRASETDAARAITATLATAVAAGRASETDEARAVAVVASLSVALGRCSETDTARAVTVAAATSVAIGRASETDEARGLVAPQSVAVGRASETDEARGVGATQASEVHGGYGGFPHESKRRAPLSPIRAQPPRRAPSYAHANAAAFALLMIDHDGY